MDLVNWLKAQRDRVVAWLLIAIGGLCILGGWIGVSGTNWVYEQLTYLVSGAIVGLFFLGVGVALLLSADFHDEWRKLDRIEAVLRGRPLPDFEQVLDLDAAQATPAAPAGTGDGRRRPERPESVMLASALPVGVGTLPIRRELTWAAPGLIVAMILIAAGWTKSSGSNDPQVGADALLIAVYGVFACGIGIALHSRWLRRALAQRKGALLGPFLKLASETDADTAAAKAGGPSVAGEFFVAESGRRYHRADCAVVATQRAVPATPAQIQQLLPCQLCQGDETAGS